MESLVMERDLHEHARINYTASLLGDCLTPRNDFVSMASGFMHSSMYILVMIDVLLFDVMMQVNQILSAIKRKKSMDAIILSLVASVCTFLIFIYWLTK
jgi:dTDP-4-amino-4,6-dideoxygalactose transaminase